jgi:hypothetical protein
MQISNHNLSHKKNREKKSHDYLTIQRTKTFDKIQLSLIIKILKKLGIEDSHLSTIKDIYDMPRGNVKLSGEN